MGKIKGLKLAQLRNNEHAEFHKGIIKEIETAVADTLGIGKLFPPYKAAVAKELAAIDVETGSHHTLTIEAADILRDELYRSLVLDVKSKLISYKPEHREAAARLKRIIDQVGELRRQPYNQETESIQSLVNQLRGSYLPDLESADLITIVNQLELANNDFNTRFGTRTAEVSARPNADVRAERIEVDRFYRDITDALNGLAVINGDTAYRPVIERINYLTDYNRTTLAQRVAHPKENVMPPVTP